MLQVFGALPLIGRGEHSRVEACPRPQSVVPWAQCGSVVYSYLGSPSMGATSVMGRTILVYQKLGFMEAKPPAIIPLLFR